MLRKEVLLLQEENRRLKLHLDWFGTKCEMVESSKEEKVTSSELESGSHFKWQVVHTSGKSIKIRKINREDLKVQNRFTILQDECTSVVSEV